MQTIIDALLNAHTDIGHWIQLAERQQKELPDCDHLPCGPTDNGIASSRRVLAEIGAALRAAREADQRQPNWSPPTPLNSPAVSELFDFIVGWKERHGIDYHEEVRLLAYYLAGRLDVGQLVERIKQLPPYEG